MGVLRDVFYNILLAWQRDGGVKSIRELHIHSQNQ
jgi:hypothetical protein